jgi:hypothetical protein
LECASYAEIRAIDDGRLQNEWSKNCLSLDADFIRDIPCDGEASQYVRQKPSNNNYVQLVTNNKCLQSINKTPGQIIRLKSCSKSKEQKFLIKRLSVNRVQFVSQYGLCLTVPYNRILVQNECGNARTSAQAFGPVMLPPEKPTPEQWVREQP